MIFSNCKWAVVAICFVFSLVSVYGNESSFLKNIQNQSQSSASLNQLVVEGQLGQHSALINNFKSVLNQASVQYSLSNINVKASNNISATFVEETCKIAFSFFNDAKAEKNYHDIDDSFSVNIYLSNDACDTLGVKNGIVLPKEFCPDGSLASVLLRSNYSAIDLKVLVLELMGSSNLSKKFEKKLAESDEDNLILRAFTVHINDDLQEVQEEIIEVISVTTGGSIRIRANGGSGDYTWRLINEIESVSKISAETGSEITYFASNDSRVLDVIVLNDGFSEIQFQVAYAKILTEKDGSGSKGKDVVCFIRKSNSARRD